VSAGGSEGRSDDPTGRPVVRICFVLSEIALVGMGLLIAARVVARGLFGYDIEFADEVGAYLLVAMSFFTLPVGQAYRTFHHVEMLHGRLGLRGRAMLDLLFNLLSLTFAVVVDVYFFQVVRSSWNQDNVAPTMLATPLWIPQLVLPLGITAVALVLLSEIRQDIRRIAAAGAEHRAKDRASR